MDEQQGEKTVWTERTAGKGSKVETPAPAKQPGGNVAGAEQGGRVGSRQDNAGSHAGTFTLRKRREMLTERQQHQLPHQVTPSNWHARSRWQVCCVTQTHVYIKPRP